MCFVSRALLSVTCITLFISGCDSHENNPADVDTNCSIPTDLIIESTAIDAIPALINPPLVDPAEATYLKDSDRVMGIVFDSTRVAVPLNILWWHEVVNFNAPGKKVAVTYCPLTGSGIVFDREAAGGAELGVAGLLYLNNLILYDRAPNPSLWPQMSRGARCGDKDGIALKSLRTIEMTWAGWRSLYPETKVVSDETGHSRNYQANPYRTYWASDEISYPLADPVDARRPRKELALGIPNDDGGIALPFGILDNGEPMRVVALNSNTVVFWDQARRSAAAFESDDHTFQIQNGRIVDASTSSEWTVDGHATSGSLAGATLEPIAEAYLAFWFAWTAFHPEIELWEGP